MPRSVALLTVVCCGATTSVKGRSAVASLFISHSSRDNAAAEHLRGK
jgi:hypothetical protein